MNESVPSLDALLEKVAKALLEVATAFNRQTQSVLALTAAIESLGKNVPATMSDHPDDEDRDHVPSHGLDGQPIHVR